jgi:HAD superfamily hydrolase (TIGR01490 family)
MSPHRKAALFDMDRTLLRVETASMYVRYQRQIGEAKTLDLAQVLWWVFLYTFNLIDAPRVAQKSLSKVKGMPDTVLAARCDDWMHRDVLQHLSDEGRTMVRKHQRQGDLVVHATGAIMHAARPLARMLDIQHIVATHLEVRDGVLTGQAEEPLAYGEGKRKRVEALLESEKIPLKNAHFYTDSITDLPLLEAVGKPFAVNPDPRLARLARRRGWPILSW